MLSQKSQVILHRRHAFIYKNNLPSTYIHVWSMPIQNERQGGDYQRQGPDQKMGPSSLVIGCETNVIIPSAILVSWQQFRFVGTLRSNWSYSRHKAKPI
jgi:hypothetical protein